MKYTITFWTPPDWQKEGSINPNFLIGAAVAIILVGALGWLGQMRAELESKKSRLAQIEYNLDSNKGDVEETRRQRACIKFWGKSLALLNGIQRNRILWSRQLETLPPAVPDSMTLSMLTVRGVEEPLPRDTPDAKLQWQGTRYSVRFRGQVEDERASAIIRRFSQELPNRPGFDGLLESVELSGESPLPPNANPGKEFVLISTYKIIDWRQGEKQ